MEPLLSKQVGRVGFCSHNRSSMKLNRHFSLKEQQNTNSGMRKSVYEIEHLEKKFELEDHSQKKKIIRI